MNNTPAIGDIVMSSKTKYTENDTLKYDCLQCDGSALDVTKYPVLASKLPTLNLPNMTAPTGSINPYRIVADLTEEVVDNIGDLT